MISPKIEGSRFRGTLSNVVLIACAFALSSAVYASQQTADPTSTTTITQSKGSSKDKKPTEPVKITLQFVRTDTANTTDTTGTTFLVSSPIMTTLDGSTATMAITGDDLSYTLGFSPKIESHGKMVQILWSVRISGKSLPGGATGITMTGASQVAPDAMAGIAEMSVTDPATGRKSVFRLQGVTTIGDAAGTISVVDPGLPKPASPPAT